MTRISDWSNIRSHAVAGIKNAWDKGLWRDTRRRVPICLRAFFAVTALFFLIWVGSLYVDARLDFQRRDDVARAELERARAVLSMTLDTYSADLMIVAQGRNLHRLAAGDRSAAAAVAQDFTAVATQKPVFVQMRYLDRSGRERVRVDRRGESVAAVDQAELQDKGDRYYFRDSIGLPEGALYVSPLDLNVERGEIETPWRPMLRLATPIVAADGQTRGVLVINIAASQLLGFLNHDQNVDAPELQFLNNEGYWLAGAPREQLWGFMFDAPTTMASAAPEAWAQIHSQESGAFRRDGALYEFTTLRFGEDAWKIVSIVQGVSMLDVLRHAEMGSPIVGLMLLALMCWIWSGAEVARRDALHEKREAERALADSEKLASLGSLVAGVAHELNTPIGNASMVSSALSESAEKFAAELQTGQLRRSSLDAFVSEVRDGAAIILRGLERASALIGHFKQVAVDQTSERRRAFALAELIGDVEAAVQPQFKGDAVSLVVDIESQARLDSYPGPLGQVLLNLIVNARMHAFGEGDTGIVSVSARDISANEVEIVVRDTGRGVPVAIREKIFEPFFTTKLGNGGSGLGLSIVYNIVTKVLGGAIRLESELHQGSAMIVRIPTTGPERNESDIKTIYEPEARKAA